MSGWTSDIILAWVNHGSGRWSEWIILCYFSAWPLVGDTGGLSNISRLENSISRLIQRGSFSIKFPVPLPLLVWLRWRSKFIYFLREESSFRVRNDFSAHFCVGFHNTCGKEPIGRQPQFQDWALLFNQRTCDPWQVGFCGLAFDAHTWTKEAWVLSTKRKETLSSGSHWGLLFRKLLWCGTVTHLWFYSRRGKCTECVLKSCEGILCGTLSSTQYWEYSVKTCFRGLKCTAALWKIWFTVNLNFIFFKERAMDKIARLAQ